MLFFSNQSTSLKLAIYQGFTYNAIITPLKALISVVIDLYYLLIFIIIYLCRVAQLLTSKL